jgi:hypothetical protein
MTNFERIKEMNREEMIQFINRMIDDGNWLLSTELEEHGIIESESDTGYDEVSMWLELDTL